MEGSWQSIQPILTEVMTMFQKDSAPAPVIKSIENTPKHTEDKVVTAIDQADATNVPKITVTEPTTKKISTNVNDEGIIYSINKMLL